MDYCEKVDPVQPNLDLGRKLNLILTATPICLLIQTPLIRHMIDYGA